MRRIVLLSLFLFSYELLAVPLNPYGPGRDVSLLIERRANQTDPANDPSLLTGCKVAEGVYGLREKREDNLTQCAYLGGADEVMVTETYVSMFEHRQDMESRSQEFTSEEGLSGKWKMQRQGLCYKHTQTLATAGKSVLREHCLTVREVTEDPEMSGSGILMPEEPSEKTPGQPEREIDAGATAIGVFLIVIAVVVIAYAIFEAQTGWTIGKLKACYERSPCY